MSNARRRFEALRDLSKQVAEMAARSHQVMLTYVDELLALMDAIDELAEQSPTMTPTEIEATRARLTSKRADYEGQRAIVVDRNKVIADIRAQLELF